MSLVGDPVPMRVGMESPAAFLQQSIARWENGEPVYSDGALSQVAEAAGKITEPYDTHELYGSMLWVTDSVPTSILLAEKPGSKEYSIQDLHRPNFAASLLLGVESTIHNHQADIQAGKLLGSDKVIVPRVSKGHDGQLRKSEWRMSLNTADELRIVLRRSLFPENATKPPDRLLKITNSVAPQNNIVDSLRALWNRATGR